MKNGQEFNRCVYCFAEISENESGCPVCGYDGTVLNEQHQLPAGTILKEQYMIGKVLGQGGFGITYLGWDMYLDIPVAIKEYFPSGTVMRETSVSMDVVSYSGDVGARFRNNKERFMREAKMLARFSQVPEIVQIKNFFLANNTAYIVMEYVDGINLKQYVKDSGGKLSSKESLELMRPVIGALRRVHKSGLVHRDISPDNIMMLPDGKIKLLDFGAVRDVGDASVDQPLTKSTEAILKQGYAPIEQYQNRGSLGPWTDVYALCATMYYCMTGQVPPDAPERLLGDDEIDFKGNVPELSDEQIEVLNQGMALRAQERIASMDELYERLYNCKKIENKTEDKTEIKKAEAGRKTDNIWSPRTFIIAALAAVAVILVIAIVVPKDGSPIVGENENVVTGECGAGLTWSLDRNTGVLTLSGGGYTDDYNGLWMEEDSDEYNPDGDYAPWVDYMQEITAVEMEDGVTHIGANAFCGAENLTEVQWSNNLQEIAWMAFSGTAIEGIVLPDSVETIGHFAFNDCRQLKHADLSYRLAYLEAGTFMNCAALENVVIRPYTEVLTNPDENEKIYTPFSCEEDGEYVHKEHLTLHTYEDAQARDFALENDIYFEHIADGRCGDNIEWKFDTETNTLYLDGYGNTWFYEIEEADLDNWAKDQERKWLFVERPDWTYTYERDIENIVILSEDISCLNCRVFAGLPNLKNVDLNSAASMDFTFENCESLEEIVIPETMGYMGSFSFNGCVNLRKVTILGEGAVPCEGTFANAVSLEEIHCSKGMSTYGDIFNPYGDAEVSEKVVFYVYEGSAMHEYAEEYGINYTIIDK